MSIPVSFTGRLTGDPEIRFTPNGVAVAKFSVATSKRTFNKQTSQYEDGPASFWNISAWRDLGENVAETLRKGQLVYVTGEMEMRSWEDKEGQKRTTPEVTAEHVGPSLKWKDKPQGEGRSNDSYNEKPPF